MWGASSSRAKDQPGLRWSFCASSCACSHSSSACQAIHQEPQTHQRILREPLGECLKKQQGSPRGPLGSLEETYQEITRESSGAPVMCARCCIGLWDLHGSCVAFVWILHGIPEGYVWDLCVCSAWCSSGDCMGPVIGLHGCCIGLAWN